jgi:Zn-dependent M28 family amino/carboxypeptidase
VRRAALGVLVALLVFVAAQPAAADHPVSGTRAKAFVRQIAAFGPRTAGSLNERRVGRLVRDQLTSFGYTVEVQTFSLPNGRSSRNVVGRGPGPVRVIVVAHMDGVHHTVAANDNGSGVATMLEVARSLHAAPGVLVAALGAEERMVTGSNFHLGSLRLVRSIPKAVRDDVVLALSIDMVGVGPTFNVRGLEASPNASARRLLTAARSLGIRATYLRDTGQSDHDDLTRGGVPATWVEWRWDPCWHLPCDRPYRLDRIKLRKAALVVLQAARTALAPTGSG